jgi:hypothetical protein
MEGDGGAWWQDLAEGSPEAREKLGGRASARGGVADDQEQDRTDRRPGYAENHLKGGDGQADGEDEQRGYPPYLEEVVRKGPDEDVGDQRRDQSGTDTEPHGCHHTDRLPAMPS